ncbi:SET domain-containing protein-lysine N-methyltransferase [Chromatium weissei]|nr:SET domain-containing protein-lysine N-methyltransferase [Chromatium weissei]
MKNSRHSNSLNHRLYAASSPIHGQGCFARSNFTAGEFIGIFEGIEMNENDAHVLWFYNTETQILMRRRGTNLLRWLNHSEQPNAMFDGFELYALRDIAIDEELTIDYYAAL